MADPLAISVAAFEQLAVGLRVVDSLTNLVGQAQDATSSATNTDVGRVYYKVRDLMAKRAILGSAQAYQGQPDPEELPLPVESPLLNVLRDMYVGRKVLAGTVYVLYDKPGQGKTTACEALLRSFYSLSDEKDIKGFMVSAEFFDDDVMGNLCRLLGADSVEGWIHAMLLAMNEPLKEQPSILILDGFNSAGKDNGNINFIKGLYQQMNGNMNIFIVVVTQKLEIASLLCNLNGGERVAPCPGCYTGDDKLNPVWKVEPWTRDLLVQAVHYRCPGKFGKEEDGLIPLDFVEEGMTPLQVVKVARSQIRPESSDRPSPKKRKTNH